MGVRKREKGPRWRLQLAMGTAVQKLLWINKNGFKLSHKLWLYFSHSRDYLNVQSLWLFNFWCQFFARKPHQEGNIFRVGANFSLRKGYTPTLVIRIAKRSISSGSILTVRLKMHLGKLFFRFFLFNCLILIFCMFLSCLKLSRYLRSWQKSS